jgi:hypothetical protein
VYTYNVYDINQFIVNYNETGERYGSVKEQICKTKA